MWRDPSKANKQQFFCPRDISGWMLCVWASNLSRVWSSGPDVRARERTWMLVLSSLSSSATQGSLLKEWADQGPVEIDLRHAMTPEDEKVVICRVNYVVVLHLRQVWELKENNCEFCFRIALCSLFVRPSVVRCHNCDMSIYVPDQTRLSHRFSTFLTVSHRFSPFLTVSHRFSLFLPVLHCFSPFLTVSHCFSPLLPVLHCFSPFLIVS